jgi:hypothetical protein
VVVFSDHGRHDEVAMLRVGVGGSCWLGSDGWVRGPQIAVGCGIGSARPTENESFGERKSFEKIPGLSLRSVVILEGSEKHTPSRGAS